MKLHEEHGALAQRPVRHAAAPGRGWRRPRPGAARRRCPWWTTGAPASSSAERVAPEGSVPASSSGASSGPSTPAWRRPRGPKKLILNATYRLQQPLHLLRHGHPHPVRRKLRRGSASTAGQVPRGRRDAAGHRRGRADAQPEPPGAGAATRGASATQKVNVTTNGRMCSYPDYARAAGPELRGDDGALQRPRPRRRRPTRSTSALQRPSIRRCEGVRNAVALRNPAGVALGDERDPHQVQLEAARTPHAARPRPGAPLVQRPVPHALRPGHQQRGAPDTQAAAD
jgi:hypothetical protein